MAKLRLALPETQAQRDELLLEIHQVLTGNGDPSTGILGRLDCIERKMQHLKRLSLGVTTGVVVVLLSSWLT